MHAASYRPKKSLGQHFLHDGNIARKIVAVLDPRKGDHVVEIGPGPGVLTALLLLHDITLTAVEIDARAVDELRLRFPAALHPRLHLVQTDILRWDIADARPADGSRLRVIGNLPYNITSPILFRLFDYADIITDAVFMMQREVANRIVAAPGGKDYGILSVLTQFHGDVRRCFHVSPNVFRPRPAVWSSVIHLHLHREKLADLQNYSFFKRIVKATFGQRRKTIANSLRQLRIPRDALNAEGERFLSLRPEQLSVGDFITLSNSIETHDG
ncbi:MAG: ribosomal RNA small subunit methyltransferase A [Bacteroidetes bacterium]|nr:ribosomal RNA small subunit methyltransferase A [Bacteroidota bacterium]